MVVDCKTVRTFAYSCTRQQSKVWNEPENRERDLRARQGRDGHVRLARLLRHALAISLLILRKKPTVLQYITLVPAFAIKLVSFLPDVAERERERPSLKCFAVLYMICTVNPKRSSLSVYMIPQ